MAEQKIIKTQYEDETVVLSNARDSVTNESYTLSKVINFADGNPMTDANCDGVIYRKKGSEYFKRNFQGGINVKWFGAVGDGIADDGIAFEKCLAVANLIKVSVYAGEKEDVFRTTKRILLKDNQILEGWGTIKKANNYTENILVQLLGNNIVVRNISVDGNRSNNLNNQSLSDVAVINGSNCSVNNIFLKDCIGNGVSVLNGSSNNITNNKIRNTASNSVLIADGASNYNNISYNDIEGTDHQNGIFVTASSGSQETGNFIYGNTISYNSVRMAGDIGIESGIHAYGTRIIGNYIFRTGNEAIIIRDNKYNIVNDNTIDCTPKTTAGANNIGISFYDQILTDLIEDYQAQCSNNIISNATVSGIVIGAKGVNVHENKIIAASVGASSGISVLKSKTSVKGNKIEGFGQAVLFLGEIEESSITDNIIKNAEIFMQFTNCNMSNTDIINNKAVSVNNGFGFDNYIPTNVTLTNNSFEPFNYAPYKKAVNTRPITFSGALFGSDVIANNNASSFEVFLTAGTTFMKAVVNAGVAKNMGSSADIDVDGGVSVINSFSLTFEDNLWKLKRVRNSGSNVVGKVKVDYI